MDVRKAVEEVEREIELCQQEEVKTVEYEEVGEEEEVG